jgi:hypothetical protein
MAKSNSNRGISFSELPAASTRLLAGEGEENVKAAQIFFRSGVEKVWDSVDLEDFLVSGVSRGVVGETGSARGTPAVGCFSVEAYT